MAGEDIVLHTQGKTRGNYCYTSDAVRGLLLLLARGNNGEAYNIANPSASLTATPSAPLPRMGAGMAGGGDRKRRGKPRLKRYRG
jgi:nucleoside-diphosphate-sugar epimerase